MAYCCLGRIPQVLDKILKAYKIRKTNPDEFEKARYEAQIVALQTGKDDENKMKHVQALYGELIQNEEASRYFDAEMKFNLLIADVNRIIGETVQSLIK